MIHITGFGSTGSKARYLAFDGAIQAMSGFSDLTGEPGRPPMMSQFLLADHTTGVHAAYAAMAALWGRARTGEGRLVELNMLDVMTSYLSGHIPARGALGQSPTRQGTGSATRYVNMFPTLDVPIYVAPVTPGMWRAFCGLIGRPEWAASGKVPNVLKDVELTAAANEVASAWFAHQTSAEAMDKLQAAGVVSGAARTVAQIYDEAVATGSPAVAFVDLPRGGTAPVPGPAFRLGQAGGGAVPGMGADTIAVLQAVGFDADALAGLSGAGVIGTHH